MKIKDRRQSKNIEVQTDKQSKAAIKGLELQDRAYENDVLREPTRIKDQGFSEEAQTMRELTNPGRVYSNLPGAAVKSPAEHRKVKDPSPSKFNSTKDFKFFAHKTKGK